MPISALNTIRNDILSIENRWHIVVEQIQSGREIRYRYEDPHFSIFNTPLNEEEITQLTQSVSMLRHFEGMPGFEWVEEIELLNFINTKLELYNKLTEEATNTAFKRLWFNELYDNRVRGMIK